MKLTATLSATMLLFFCCAFLSAQDNLFMEFAGKPYATYYVKLDQLLYRQDVLFRDSVWVAKTVAQMREAAQLSKDKKWALEADFFEIFYRYHSDCLLLGNEDIATQTELLSNPYSNDLQQIIREAKKMKAFDIELRALYEIWKSYYERVNNFEMSFRYCRELDKALSVVTAEAFPLRTLYYCQIGQQYHVFEEYETAAMLYEKALECTFNDFILNDLCRVLNNMGLIYRNHLNDLARSDSCYYGIIEMKFENPALPFHGVSLTSKEICTNQDVNELWTGIAKGNLGTNCYLRGEYDAAIPLLIYGMEKAVEDENPHNYPYAAGKAITLSEIYLTKSDFHAAKQYADKAFEFLDKSRKRDVAEETKDVRYWIQYYDLMSSYCRMTDNPAQALLYADSSGVAHARHDAAYSLRKLHYAEIHAKELELEAEALRSSIYYRNLIVVVAFALLLLSLLTLLYIQYRKKQHAYRELVHKSQEWAQTAVEFVPIQQPAGKKRNGAVNLNNGQSISETDRQLFERMQQLIQHERLYCDDTVSLEKVAQRLKVNKNYLSRAVNSCTGDNFNAFVNEYRIREAVLMLTEMPDTFTIEGIGNAAGFNDRKTFYTAFKKKTGLSPSDFRKNLQGN